MTDSKNHAKVPSVIVIIKKQPYLLNRKGYRKLTISKVASILGLPGPISYGQEVMV